MTPSSDARISLAASSDARLSSDARMSSDVGNGNGVLLCSLHSGAGRVLSAASILLSLPPYFDATKQTVGRHQKGASSSDNGLPPALFGVHVSSVVGALNGLENLGCSGPGELVSFEAGPCPGETWKSMRNSLIFCNWVSVPGSGFVRLAKSPTPRSRRAPHSGSYMIS